MFRLQQKKETSAVSRRRSLPQSHSLRHELPGQIKEVVDAAEENDASQVSGRLTRLIENSAELGIPKPFLSDIKYGINSGDWSRFALAFKNTKFLGKDGRFLLIAPYTTSRQGKRETRLSAIYGRRLDLGTIPPSAAILHELFGELRERIPQMVPFHAYAGAGWFAGEAGEAFVVPNGWAGLPDGDGPVLNNVSEQMGRVRKHATEAIRQIFDAPSATLLLSAYTPEWRLMTTLNQEYSLHEAGHASGIGLSHKMAAGALNSPFFGAVEEWRSDGVGFELARMLLPAETAGTLIASNLITRFGIDAHRKGALELDTDVNSALLTFQSLIESGALQIHADNRLGFLEPTFTGLVRATQLMGASALALTRKEMQLSDPHGIWTLYPTSVAVSESVRCLFRQMVVTPCKEMYRELR